MRLRSIALVAADGANLDLALESAADAVAFTLNDAGIAVGSLRRAAVSAMSRVSGAGKLCAAIVNHPRTRLLRDDLDAVVTLDLRAVLLPHAVEPQDVRDTAVVLREFEYNRGIEPGTVKLFPVIDTARGLLRAADIAHAAPRVGGLVFDGEAYSRDAGARDEPVGPRFAYARGAVVAAARAVDGLPVISGEAFDLVQVAHHGFAAAVLHDLGHAAAANAAFTPTTAEVAHARAQVACYAAARKAGEWVGRLGTEVVEADTVRRARQTLAQAGIDLAGEAPTDD